MPKSMLTNNNIAASTKTANLLSGDVNEFIPYDANVRITQVSSAGGVNVSIFADSDLLVDDKPIPFIGTSLIDKDHVVDDFDVAAGTRLAIFLRETAGAATTDVLTGVEVTPL